MLPAIVTLVLVALCGCGSVSAKEEDMAASPPISKISRQVQSTYRNLTVNDDWVTFTFGLANSWVDTIFVINAAQPLQLLFADGYCLGDDFAIYVNGTLLGTAVGQEQDGCKTNYTDPQAAYTSGIMSNFTATLDPGNYEVKILVLDSPFSGGIAFIRLSLPNHIESGEVTTTTTTTTLSSHPTTTTSTSHRRSSTTSSSSSSRPTVPPHHLKECSIRDGDLRVILTKVSSHHASQACSKIGARLASINIFNFMRATNLLFECAGPFSKGWIHSWNGDNYGGACILLHTGATSPGGSVNPARNCGEHHPVVCIK